MILDWIIPILIGFAITIILIVFAWPPMKRRRILRRTFPTQWLRLLEQKLPIYHKLREPIQNELQNQIKLFLSHKQFVGCAGVDIDDIIRVTVAAQACLLLLNRPTHEYNRLRYIYVYPSSFRATRDVRDELGLVSKESRDLLGESWDSGKIILAWDSVEQGIRNFSDGHNVVLHEFAHQLDQESGSANGAPLLYTKAAYKSWAYIFGREFNDLQKKNHNRKSIIDHYGATNPAEFFAVATETFFEEPTKMFKHHRELFEELQQYYRVDPRDWA